MSAPSIDRFPCAAFSQRGRLRGSRQIASSQPWSLALAALRERLFREACARVLQRRELLESPLKDLPPSQALRQLARTQFEQGDFSRTHEVLALSQQFVAQNGRGESEEIRALRAFLAGRNFERAEQFAEAAASYRSVLTCIGEFVPVAAAADRLKALRKEQPEIFKSPSAPNFPAGPQF